MSHTDGKPVLLDRKTLDEVFFRISWIDRPILEGCRFTDKPRDYSNGYRDALDDCMRCVKAMMAEQEAGK